MILMVGDFSLRRPEPFDVDFIYAYRNDTYINSSLGAFSRGFSKTDVLEWIEYQRKSTHNQVWIIADEKNQCIGHVGLYGIDYRTRVTEFGICIGDKSVRGKGLSRKITNTVLGYAFNQMNLRKVSIKVLDTNEISKIAYRRFGFQDEGILRQEEFRDGQYIDVIAMGLFKEEWEGYINEDVKKTTV